MVRPGVASAQPKFTTTPDTVAPWPGVSIEPNGFNEVLLVSVTRREPSSVVCPA